MTIDNVLELMRGGFSKDEILAFMNEPKAEPKVEPKAEPKVEPKNETVTLTKEQFDALMSKPIEPKTDDVKPKDNSENVSFTNEQFAQLMQGVNLKNASVDLPNNKSVEDVLGDRLKNLMGVK